MIVEVRFRLCSNEDLCLCRHAMFLLLLSSFDFWEALTEKVASDLEGRTTKEKNKDINDKSPRSV